MRLQEEYFRKHNINFPPIYHVKNANLIFNSIDGKLGVLNIEFFEITRHPGHYIIKSLTPNYNGYINGKYFLESEIKLQYEEYLNYIVEWSKSGFIPIKIKDIKFALWKIFLYCFESWVATHKLKKAVRNQDKFLNYLEEHHCLVKEIYNTEFLKFEYNYADWLVELVNCQNIMKLTK